MAIPFHPLLTIIIIIITRCTWTWTWHRYSSLCLRINDMDQMLVTQIMIWLKTWMMENLWQQIQWCDKLYTFFRHSAVFVMCVLCVCVCFCASFIVIIFWCFPFMFEWQISHDTGEHMSKESMCNYVYIYICICVCEHIAYRQSCEHPEWNAI